MGVVMSKRYTGRYIIRWDHNGESHRKIYDDYQTVLSAQKWLIKSGAVDVDIAVEVSSLKPQE